MTGLLLDEMYPPVLALQWDFARLAPVTPHAGIIFVSAHRFPRTRNGLVRLGAALDPLLTTKRLPPADGVVWLNSPVRAEADLRAPDCPRQPFTDRDSGC